MPKQMTSIDSAFGRSMIGMTAISRASTVKGGHPGAADPEVFLLAQAASLPTRRRRRPRLRRRVRRASSPPHRRGGIGDEWRISD